MQVFCQCSIIIITITIITVNSSYPLNSTYTDTFIHNLLIVNMTLKSTCKNRLMYAHRVCTESSIDGGRRGVAANQRSRHCRAQAGCHLPSVELSVDMNLDAAHGFDHPFILSLNICSSAFQTGQQHDRIQPCYLQGLTTDA